MELSPTKYLGLTKFSKTLENYHLSLTYHDSDKLIPKHYHKNPYFSLNLQAPYVELGNSTKEIIAPGQVLIRPAFYEHKNTFIKSNGICFNIELITNKELFEITSKRKSSIHEIPIIKILTSIINQCQDDELDCLITEILVPNQKSKLNPRISKWYSTIIEKIYDDYSQELSLSILANTVGLHPSYIARKFKLIHGSTISEFIKKVRLEKAALSICNQKKLTEVALECGFYDQAHFSKSFASTYNINPKHLKFFTKS